MPEHDLILGKKEEWNSRGGFIDLSRVQGGELESVMRGVID